jgi:integrase/recombinase XerD
MLSLNEGMPPNPSNIQLPAGLDRDFRAFLDFARGYQNHSSATLKWYEQTYHQFRAFLLGADVATLQPYAVARHVERWICVVRARGVSPFTVRSYWQAIRAFFTYLESHREFPNPFRVLPPPMVPVAAPKARSPIECVRILDAVANADWPTPFLRTRATAVIATALYAGLRKGEILRLKFADVDFDSATILIVRGKGEGGGKDRTTYVAPELLRYLKEYVAERRRQQFYSVEFFTSTRSGRGLSAQTLTRIVQRTRLAAGIPFTLHQLRHSFITELVRESTPIHIVRDLAGHESIQTTERYLRVFDIDKREYIRRLSFM